MLDYYPYPNGTVCPIHEWLANPGCIETLLEYVQETRNQTNKATIAINSTERRGILCVADSIAGDSYAWLGYDNRVFLHLSFVPCGTDMKVRPVARLAEHLDILALPSGVTAILRARNGTLFDSHYIGWTQPIRRLREIAARLSNEAEFLEYEVQEATKFTL